MTSVHLCIRCPCTRGVDLIGASSRDIMGDLDQGPIIEQDTTLETHTRIPEHLTPTGSNAIALPATPEFYASA